MNNNESLKKFVDFMKAVDTTIEIQNWIKEKNYLQNFKRNVAILKITNKIDEKNIEMVTNELIYEFNNKYNTCYKYNGNYIESISIIENDIEQLINKVLLEKLKEKEIDKLLSGVFNNNE